MESSEESIVIQIIPFAIQWFRFILGHLILIKLPCTRRVAPQITPF